MAPLGPDDLILCAGTLAQTPLAERIALAAEAGYTGLSLFLDDLERASLGTQELRQRLADHGLRIGELDPLMSWVPGAAPVPGIGRFDEDAFYRAADATGARSINAACFASEVPERPVLIDAFGALCDRAAAHGLLVHLEFMPFAPIATLGDALAIVAGADRSNGGLMFDAWHLVRSGGTAAELEQAAHRVTATQLDDVQPEAEPDLVAETLHRRLLPGEGAADLVGLVRALDAGGCQAPIGVEVFNDALQEKGARQVAYRTAEATRRVLAQARA